MASFTAMQQSANDDRTTMRQLMETITRRLANPMEPIESLCINLRYPSDESTTQRRAFGVTINPPVPSANGSGFDQYWVPFFDSIPSGDLDRLSFASIPARMPRTARRLKRPGLRAHLALLKSSIRTAKGSSTTQSYRGSTSLASRRTSALKSSKMP